MDGEYVEEIRTDGGDVQPGQQLRLEITGLISDGRGLARHNGRAVFVADALPGQRVTATVTTVKPRLAEARLDSLTEHAPNARPALCPHSGDCGGCTWQAMPYAEQLGWKERFVVDALQRIGRVAEPPVLPVLPAPREWNYRNKMEFAFAGSGAGSGKDLSLGLRRRGSHGIVDVSACLLQSELTMRVLACVRRSARETGVAAWNRKDGGLWRFLVIREPEAGGCLVELIVGPHPEAVRHGQALAEAVFAACPAVTGFVLSERRSAADVAYGEKIVLRQGVTELTERVGGVELQLGAGAFFQVNTAATELLYAEAARMAGAGPVRNVWDVYCGVGSIGLYLARHLPVETLTGMEQSAQAVRLARINAQNTHVPATYHKGEAARIMMSMGGDPAAVPDLAVVDPPRAGLEAEVASLLCRLRPERILYVSCDPATLARDAARLAPYRLMTVRPVDLFPQTPHVESVALFALNTAQ